MNIIAIILSFLAPNSALAAPGDGGVFITAGTVSTKTLVHFYLENSAGQRSGQLPNGTRVAEIPDTQYVYGTEAHGDDDTGAPGYEHAHFETSPFQAGDYKLILVPQATTSYWLNVSIRNDNDATVSKRYSGLAVVGTTATFTFSFNPTAPAPTLPIKAVTFASLRQSLQAALQIGQLGDAGFVSRLDKMLIKAEDQANKGQKKQSADRLDQFIHRLDSAFKKEPDPYTDDDPDDKKSASSMKRFILEQARNALRDDARTLIISLGETPKR